MVEKSVYIITVSHRQLDGAYEKTIKSVHTTKPAAKRQLEEVETANNKDNWRTRVPLGQPDSLMLERLVSGNDYVCQSTYTIEKHPVSEPPMYHGSCVTGLSIIEPQEGRAVFATPDKLKALAFARDPRVGDLDYTILFDVLGKKMVLVERYWGCFERHFAKPGSVYSLSEDGFEAGLYDFEYTSTNKSKVVSEDRFENVLLELECSPDVELYRYPTRPDMIPDDDSDLVKKLQSWAAHDELMDIDPNIFLSKVESIQPRLVEEVRQKLQLSIAGGGEV